MSAYYRKRYKRKHGVLHRYIIIGAVLLSFVFIIVNYVIKVNDVIVSVTKAAVKSMTTRAINEAVFSTTDDVLSYKELVNIQRNDSGDIVAVTSDSIKINSLARKTAIIAQNKLETLNSGGVKIPVGAFSGLEMLAGLGPKISVKLVKIESVACDFFSEFSSVGINQTRHSVYIKIYSEVNIVLSSKIVPVNCDSSLLVAESVIVGKVPDTYFNGNFNGFGTDIIS